MATINLFTNTVSYDGTAVSIPKWLRLIKIFNSNKDVIERVSIPKWLRLI